MPTKNVLTAVAAVIAASIVGVTSGAAAEGGQVLYRETFNVPDPARRDTVDPADGKAVAAALGWVGFRNGASFDNPCIDAEPGETCLQAFGTGSAQRGSVGNPRVFRGSGNAFWSPQVIGATIYTEELRPRPTLA